MRNSRKPPVPLGSTPGQTFTISGTALSNSTTGNATYSTTPSPSLPLQRYCHLPVGPPDLRSPHWNRRPPRRVVRTRAPSKVSRTRRLTDRLRRQLDSPPAATRSDQSNSFSAPSTINGWTLTNQNAVQMAISGRQLHPGLLHLRQPRGQRHPHQSRLRQR